MKITPATEEELIDFLQWYWREVQGLPYQTTSEEIVNFYLDDKK